MAVGWGGLVGTIGLAASAGSPLWVRVLAVVAAFLVGGFLSGVRTLDRRVTTAALGCLVGWLMWAAIVVVLALVHLVGGPVEPEFAPGTDPQALVLAGASLVSALIGGLAAQRRYSGRRRVRGRR